VVSLLGKIDFVLINLFYFLCAFAKRYSPTTAIEGKIKIKTIYFSYIISLSGAL
jgi:hypothetical protein